MGQSKVSGHGRVRLNPSGNLQIKHQDKYKKWEKNLLEMEAEMDAEARLKDPNFKGVRALGEECLEWMAACTDGMSLDERALFMRSIKDEIKKAK